MIEKIAGSMRLNRRSFLQWAGALSVTATAYGCGGSSDDSVVAPMDSMKLDKTVQEVCTGHVSHCGAMCMLKLHVKNGKLLKVTSGGDIPITKEKANAKRLINANGSTRDEKAGIVPGVWTQSDAADESMGPIQRRACMKGLSETKMVYAPDRLKYPLEQTLERGNLKGFRRITWENAFNKIKAMFDDMQAEKQRLGLPYLPVYDASGMGRLMGNYTVSTYGASSTGGVNDGYWASIGYYDRNNYNPALDMLNANFIIVWSNDLRSNRNTWPFYLQKAKDLGIHILDINAYHTDTGAATGYNPTPEDGVPPHITTNAGTDSCFQTALAYVILKNKWYDDAYLEEFSWAWAPEGYPKRAYSGIPTDTSKSTDDVRNEMNTLHTAGNTTATWKRKRADGAKTQSNTNPTYSPKHSEWPKVEYTTARATHNKDLNGDDVTDATKAQIGDSFVEYLISLEHKWGGAEHPLYWCTNHKHWEYDGPTEDSLSSARHTRRFPAQVGDSVYNNVLKYAEKITGVKAEVIEAIAKKYSHTRTFVISFYSGGASRSQNGMYHTWMMIALQSMCGHLNKRGGGSSEMLFGDGHMLKLGDSPVQNAVVPANPSGTGTFPILNWCLGDTIISGHDSRTISELQYDTYKLTSGKVDLGTKGATIKMFYRAAGHNSPLQQQPDLTKNMHVFKNKDYMKYIIVHELFMNPLAAIADIVLPAGHYFETTTLTDSYVHDRIMSGSQGTIKPLYDTRRDQQIVDDLFNYCGFETNRNPDKLSDDEIMEEQWKGSSIPASYQPILDKAPATSPKEIPPFEKMKEDANLQLVVPLDEVKSVLETIPAGQLWSQTGYVQFMSPWMKEVDSRTTRPTGLCIRGGWRAGYHQLDEGYERLLDYTNGTPDGTPGTGMPGLKRKDISVGVKKTSNGAQETVFTDNDINNRVRYPLQLGTPHMIQRAHAHWDNIAVLKDLNPHVVHMHPSTAGKRGINDGDMVYVYNDNGCIKIPAKVTRRVKPQSIIIGQGAWYRASTTETYKAFFRNAAAGVEDRDFRQGSDYAAPVIGVDMAGNPIPDPERKGNSGDVVMWEVPVDVGGAVNSLCLGRNCGTGTPLISGSVALPTVGMLCEVSKTHPDKI